MKYYHNTEEDSEGKISNTQVLYNTTPQRGCTVVTLQVIRIGRYKVIVFTFATQLSLAVEIATGLLILFRNVWQNFVICSNLT
jgi:hypothetical protein